MLSYRHGFHAGNPADVLKHAALIALVQAMQVKDKGFCYVDTHAGAALYDLKSAFALKNREHEKGIGRLWFDPPPGAALNRYRDLIRQFNPDGALRWYPGSPALVREWLRPQDRMLLCELHGTEAEILRERYQRDAQVAVHQRNGYEALKALLPPKEKRGLILIDPPYELKNEVADMKQALTQALQRFASGVYAIWYPYLQGRDALQDIKEHGPIKRLETHNLRFDFPESITMGRMSGCGLFIINPPWHAREALVELGQIQRVFE
ncbi:MAG: 23S rRNA (adenine(2030)-N(6))-methyltransferase RlmJ [Wenzhouxiangellaceae bacterium]